MLVRKKKSLKFDKTNIYGAWSCGVIVLENVLSTRNHADPTMSRANHLGIAIIYSLLE